MEISKDNQWWYGQSPHRGRVEGQRFAVIRVSGRVCPMEHSEVGSDGRPTYSFTFLHQADRAYWQSLRGQPVEVEVLEAGSERPVVDFACGDDDDDDALAEEPATEAVHDAIVAPRSIRRTTPTAFDEFVISDWSANSTPKRGKDSVWTCHASFNDVGLLTSEVENFPTRQDAIRSVHSRLVAAVEHRRRVMVGFDFPYGLPFDGYARVLRPCANWRDYWAELAKQVSDGPRNANNRFAVASALNQGAGTRPGPFWGAPARKATAFLQWTKPVPPYVPPAEFRLVEEILRSGGRRPFSVWQLFGNGSVGGQALVGLPSLWKLIDDEHLKPHSVVWPFDANWSGSRRPLIVHAEVWPGAIDVDLGRHSVRDAAQVMDLAEWAAARDVTGDLSNQFRAFESTPARRQRAVVEGWILGVT